MKPNRWTALIMGAILYSLPLPSWAASGDEGAAFLDIPVGAGPASMGAAYTALATDAYAATWNPAGLGFIPSTQFSGQHVEYLDTLHYEYLSFGLPLPRSKACTENECHGSGLGGSIQYLGSGDVTGRDFSGNETGNFSSYYSAYNLAYGHSFGRLSLGLTGKFIHAQIDDVSASAYAADLGALYVVNQKWTLGTTLTNVGTQLKFLSEGDSLPLAFHLAGAFRPTAHWLFAAEGVYTQAGLASLHLGGEWHPIELLALRTGYRTDTVKGLSPLAGYTLGMGLQVWGQELAYAWLPYGDLGSTHYISLLLKFGEAERAKKNLIQYQNIKKHRSVDSQEPTPDEQQMIELMNPDGSERRAQQRSGSNTR